MGAVEGGSNMHIVVLAATGVVNISKKALMTSRILFPWQLTPELSRAAKRRRLERLVRLHEAVSAAQVGQMPRTPLLPEPGHLPLCPKAHTPKAKTPGRRAGACTDRTNQVPGALATCRSKRVTPTNSTTMPGHIYPKPPAACRARMRDHD